MSDLKRREKLLHILKPSVIGVLMICLLIILFTICIWITSAMSSALTAPTEAADRFLKALQQHDKKMLDQMLVDPHQTSTILRRWDQHITMAGSLRSWQLIRAEILPEVEFSLGNHTQESQCSAHIEYRGDFEKSQFILRIRLILIEKKWKIESFDILFPVSEFKMQ